MDIIRPRPHTAEMTFWSRYDPVSQPRGNTDHWTKLKQRAVNHRSLNNPISLGVPLTLGGIPRSQAMYGRVARRTTNRFDEYVLDALNGNLPGNYMYSFQPRNKLTRENTRSSYNDRAREGFRYWLIERPKPTSFGKYGMGSYKTVLGVGNAPRT